MQNVEGAKCMCFVLANAAEGRVTVEFKAFLAYSSTELLKALTRNIDTVRNSMPCLSFKPSVEGGNIVRSYFKYILMTTPDRNRIGVVRSELLPALLGNQDHLYKYCDTSDIFERLFDE